MRPFFISLIANAVLAPLALSAAGEFPPAGLVPYTTAITSVSNFYSRLCIVGEWVLVFGILIGVIFIVWGGIQYITSAGDEQKATRGKSAILYAIVGVVFLVLAISIVNIVGSAFGSSFRFAFNCGLY